MPGGKLFGAMSSEAQYAALKWTIRLSASTTATPMGIASNTASVSSEAGTIDVMEMATLSWRWRRCHGSGGGWNFGVMRGARYAVVGSYATVRPRPSAGGWQRPGAWLPARWARRAEALRRRAGTDTRQGCPTPRGFGVPRLAGG